MVPDLSQTVETACRLISARDFAGAERVIQENYPFQAAADVRRSYSASTMARVLYRDGFIDRYRGTRLVFPPVLRLLSLYLPDAFPYHPNWKMTATHIGWWELCPTIDHVQPIARGGADTADNWVTCSMLTNSIKANWTLEDLQWRLRPPGDPRDWDGMLGWLVQRLADDPVSADYPYIKRWRSVARELAAISAEARETAA